MRNSGQLPYRPLKTIFAMVNSLDGYPDQTTQNEMRSESCYGPVNPHFSTFFEGKVVSMYHLHLMKPVFAPHGCFVSFLSAYGAIFVVLTSI